MVATSVFQVTSFTTILKIITSGTSGSLNTLVYCNNLIPPEPTASIERCPLPQEIVCSSPSCVQPLCWSSSSVCCQCERPECIGVVEPSYSS